MTIIAKKISMYKPVFSHNGLFFPQNGYRPFFILFFPYGELVVVCGMVISCLSPSTGLVNVILRNLGFEEHSFMVDPKAFRPIYTIMIMWRETGFNAIVFIAALMGIDRQLYEAAKVDGASKWQQIRHVTLPGLMPTIVIMFILHIGILDFFRHRPVEPDIPRFFRFHSYLQTKTCSDTTLPEQVFSARCRKSRKDLRLFMIHLAI